MIVNFSIVYIALKIKQVPMHCSAFDNVKGSVDTNE